MNVEDIPTRLVYKTVRSEYTAHWFHVLYIAVSDGSRRSNVFIASNQTVIPIITSQTASIYIIKIAQFDFRAIVARNY